SHFFLKLASRQTTLSKKSVLVRVVLQIATKPRSVSPERLSFVRLTINPA
ncbi:MAG: hypothetical protein ACI9RP_001183, partial [Cyclobacteriaceae bacterium]